MKTRIKIFTGTDPIDVGEQVNKFIDKTPSLTEHISFRLEYIPYFLAGRETMIVGTLVYKVCDN